MVRVRYACQRIHILLQREGQLVNRKKTHRIYCMEGLNLRTKRPRCPDNSARAWILLLIICLTDGRIRALTVVDNFVGNVWRSRLGRACVERIWLPSWGA